MSLQNQDLNLMELLGVFAICRLDSRDPIPSWALIGSFFSISRTSDELSVVCEQANVPTTVKCEAGWKCFRVAGKLDFALTGILASLTAPLAKAGISVFGISTYDTDYLLVKDKEAKRARDVLAKAGYKVE